MKPLPQRAVLAVLLATLSIAAGCFPTERVIWSPDGKQFIVIAGDGLRLGDADGKLTGPLEPQALRACWLPDSRRLLVVTRTEVTNWDELAATLPDSVLADATNRSAKLHAWLQAQPTNSPLGQWNVQWNGQNASSNWVWSHELLWDSLAVMHARTTEAGVALNRVPALKAVTAGCQQLVLYEAANGTLTNRRVLASHEQDILTLAASPNGKACAFVAAEFDPRGESVAKPELFATALNGSTRPLRVAQNVAVYFDWSPDGRSLVYTETSSEAGGCPGGAPEHMGSVRTCRVYADEGLVFSVDASEPDHAPLVTVAFDPFLRVCWLTNGAVLFTPIRLELPQAPQAAESIERTVCLADPANHTIRCLYPTASASAMGELRSLHVSPDGKYFSTYGTNGSVLVVSIEGGKVETVEPAGEEDGRYPKSIPAWRSTGELCFVGHANPANGEHAPQPVILWSPATKQRTDLSKAWPAEARDGWLNR